MPLCAAAHEFWVDPVEYQIDPGDTLTANIRVGDDMKGAPLTYIPNRVRRFEMATPSGLVEVEPRIGDRPVAVGKLKEQGLHTLIYATADSTIRYVEDGKFTKFLKGKGLDAGVKEHSARGLPDVGFSERYSRYTKALVAVGQGQGQDRERGLLTEITALANPYTDDLRGGLPVRVTYLGKPRANAQIEIFSRGRGNKVFMSKIQTDAQGVATIPITRGRKYMLDAVVLKALDPEDNDGAVWETFWANLTFAVPE